MNEKHSSKPCVGSEASSPYGCCAYAGKTSAARSSQINPILQCPRQQFGCKAALARRPRKCVKTLLSRPPTDFRQAFCCSSARSRDPLSSYSLAAHLAFLGPLWQLQPLWRGEFLAPLLFQRGAEGARIVAGCQCQKWPFLMEIRQNRPALSTRRKERPCFFFALPGRLRLKR